MSEKGREMDRVSPGCVGYRLPDGRGFEVDMKDDDNPDRVLKRAAEMAYYRGGGTHPISDYDIRNAREEISGEIDEIARLRRELAQANARIGELTALPTPKDDSHGR